MARSRHLAANYLLGQLPVGQDARRFFESYVLTLHDETALQVAATEDVKSYLFNATVSFLCGLESLSRSHAVWATAQLYYSAFYVARAALTQLGILIYHVPKFGSGKYTQMTLEVNAGATSSVSTTASTHKHVLNLFHRKAAPTFLKGAIIDGLEALEWLSIQRDAVQYRLGRFSDPDAEDLFRFVSGESLSRLIEQYIADSKNIYIVDREHAMLALPVRLLEWALDKFAYPDRDDPESEQRSYLRRACRVGGHPVAAINRRLL